MQSAGTRKQEIDALHPLNSEQLSRLSQAIGGLSPSQLNWASGYLAGIASVGQSLPLQEAQQADTLTILYASQTGNAQSVAQQLADSAAARGIEARLISSANFKPRDLAKEKILLLVVSTQGEGEVPESAVDLQKFIHSRKAPDLSGLSFAVFGLGDSSYEQFCQAGVDFDQRLAELGAIRLIDRVDADVDFESASELWIPDALTQVEELEPNKQAVVLPISPAATPARYSRNQPYEARLIENRRLTTDKALADVRHIVLEIDPGSLQYQAGDSLGIWFKNDPVLIARILNRLQLDGASEVRLAELSLTLQHVLSEKRELTLLNPAVVNAWSGISDSDELKQIIEDRERLREFSAKRQFIDLVTDFPGKIGAQALVDLLKPLQPRLYSIASSQSEYEDEIHLTVSALQYQVFGRAHQGAASGFLVDRIAEDDVLGIYVVENESFRLPGRGDTPIIMIGAGTGVAPFRSFMQERQSRGDKGQNWLFFGNRHFHEDFLYQTDWIKHRENGLLNKVSVAFSRDSEQRIYVQDRLLEQGKQVYEWIEQGAYIYVCGGLDMEAGIADSLKSITSQFGGKNKSEADQFVERLRHEGRYLRDVY